MKVSDGFSAPHLLTRTSLLRSGDVLFAALWVGVPNAVFVGLWFFACPVRVGPMFAYVLVGLLTARASVWTAALALAAAILFDVLWFISIAYNLSIAMLAQSLPFAYAAQFHKSPVFVAAAVGLSGVFCAILYLRSHWSRVLGEARPYLALLAASGLAIADLSLNLAPTIPLFGVASASTPFQSATELSGFRERVISGDTKRAMLVLVEGWGELSDASLRSRVEQPLTGGRLAELYEISTGSVPFVGSTTAGEARELCGTRSTHAPFLANNDVPNCLPAELHRAGYQTVGVHAFTEDFFERDVWWPRTGLQQSYFAEDLLAMDGHSFHRSCGPVFSGLCDEDVGTWIHSLLSKPHEKPLFVYWLTLNSHLPLIPEIDGSMFGCATPADAFGDAQTCAMADIWHATFSKITEIASDPRIPPTEFLIVGDHSPPSWTRRGRNHFHPGVVRWISLSPKAGQGKMPRGAP